MIRFIWNKRFKNYRHDQLHIVNVVLVDLTGYVLLLCVVDSKILKIHCEIFSMSSLVNHASTLVNHFT